MSGKTVDLGAAFNFAIAKFKANPGMMLSFGGTDFLVSLILGGVVAVVGQILMVIAVKINPFLAIPVVGLQWIVQLALAVAITSIIIIPFLECLGKDAAGGKSNYFDELKKQDKLKNATIAAIISFVIIIIGTCLCVIPGLLAAPILPVSLYFVWKGESGVDAVKKAFDLLRSDLMAYLSVLIFNIIAGIGLILCLVGIVASIPFGFTGIWHICEQKCNKKPSDETPVAAPAKG